MSTHTYMHLKKTCVTKGCVKQSIALRSCNTLIKTVYTL